MNPSCETETRPVLPPPLTLISVTLQIIRRELEKLRKDLEEEKLMRSNLEVI